MSHYDWSDPDAPWSPDPHVDPVAAGGVERDFSGVPVARTVPDVETATWCATRNGYATEDCGVFESHTHYDVQYDGNTGKVLTSPEEQARRRRAAASDRELWHEVTYALLHTQRGAIYTSANFLRDHPAMQELLRRERERGSHPQYPD